MQKKPIIALVLLGVLAVATIGLVAAQTATPTPGATTQNPAQSNGFWGWMGRCFGLRDTTYYGTQAPVAPQQPLNITVTNPNTGTTTTYQGYGYGPCMRGFAP